MNQFERYQGCLLGLAVGDALGTTLEFQVQGTFKPIALMEGGGPFALAPGQWTDDTSMALWLAESLIELDGFDPGDQMERYLRWWWEGFLSSTGQCFDIGHTTLQTLQRFERDHQPYAGSTNVYAAGNGSLMRLAPIPLAYLEQPEKVIHLAALSSRTAHASEEAVDVCRYFASLLVGALQGLAMEKLLADGYTSVPGLWEAEPLSPAIAHMAGVTFKALEPPQVRATRYVVKTLKAALWAFQRGTCFRDSLLLLAVNLGDDADTVGAVCGQLAGAFYGLKSIPRLWLEPLAMSERILENTEKLFHLASRLKAQPLTGELPPSTPSGNVATS